MEEKQMEPRNTIKSAINDCYKEVGGYIRYFPQILQIKVHIFNEMFADQLRYSVDAVQRFTTKKMTSDVSYNELFTALIKVMKSTADKGNESNPERAKELFLKYIKNSSFVFLCIAEAYSRIELCETYYELLKNDKYAPDTLTMEMTLGKFILGLWPENSNGLSSEEADYLRKCLKCIPLTRIKPENVKDKSDYLTKKYREICDKEISNKDLLDKKTLENFGIFLKILLQNSGDNYSETENFIRELLNSV